MSSEQKAPERNDMLDVFIRALEGADFIVVVTPNDIGGLDASHMRAPEILAAWNVRADLAPKVKPLEWYESPDDDTDFCADALGLTYCVFVDIDGLACWGFLRSVSGWTIDNEDGDIERAKAAAQADCEARILAALEWKPAPQWQPISTAPRDGEPNWEGFARDMLDEWPVRDVDGSELFDAALRRGLIREIPGGYDPENHIDAEGICPEAGDPWYEYAFGPAAPEAD